MFVITADQRASRRRGDAVPAALAALADPVLPGLVLAFERTAGDEIQGVVGEPGGVVEAVTRLARLGGWRVGVGVGDVDRPLATHAREASGPAFFAARRAVEDARGAPGAVAVRGPADGRAVRRADAAVVLLASLLGRRSAAGWEATGLVDRGLTGAAAAGALGISPSAVSQRLRAAGAEEGARAAALATDLLGDADR